LDINELIAQNKGKTLKFAGVYVGEVLMIESGHRTPQVWVWEVPVAHILRNWYDAFKGIDDHNNAKAESSQYVGDYIRHEASAKLALGDLIRDMEQLPIRKLTKKDLEAVFMLMEFHDVGHYIRRTVYGMLANQTFFTTHMGLIRSGHLDIRPGDEVWVLNGGRVPFVVRPRETGNLEHTFVGQSYVQGAMQGEIFDSGVRTQPTNR
jgi:hypothetical protein